MQWTDSGFVLAARRHGESAAIVELLTREHGRHAGLVRGGQSPKLRAVLQQGNEVVATWRGRLSEHLGTLGLEPVHAHAARLIDRPLRLSALAAATTLVAAVLPEREPHPELFTRFSRLVAALDSADDWGEQYVVWECDLLAGLGFGLDLSRCAATGTTAELAFVSPRTGRAVSRAAGEPYRAKLLALPDFLWREQAAEPADIVTGLDLTGHFLLHHLLAPAGHGLPPARTVFADRMRRAAAAGSISE